MNPKISIIIPSKNGALYIARALNSVLSQRFTEWECIIVDDGSTDDTHALIQTFAAKDSRFIIIHREKSAGPGNARREAIERARAPYVALLDDDDVWSDPEKLDRQYSYLEEHTHCGIVGTRRVIQKNEKGEILATIHNPEDAANIRTSMLWRNPFATSSVVFRKSIYNKTQGFGPGYVAEDYELWLSMCRFCEGANIDSEITYFVRMGSLSRRRKIAMAKTVLRLVWAYKTTYPGFIPAYTKALVRVLRAVVAIG